MRDKNNLPEHTIEYFDASGTLPPNLPYPQLEGTAYCSIVEYVEDHIAKKNQLRRAVKLRRLRYKLMSYFSLRKP